MEIQRPYEWLVRPDAVKDRSRIDVRQGIKFDLSDRPDIAALIDAEWELFNQPLREKGSRWADVSNPRYTLSRYEVNQEGVLSVALGPLEYKYMAMTHDLALTKPEVFETIKAAGKLPYTVGVSCAIKTADGLMLVLERSAAVSALPNLYHVVGGYPHPEAFVPPNIPLEGRMDWAKKQIDPKRINLFEAVRMQIRAETGLGSGTYQMWVAGIAHDPRILEPEIIFCADASLTLAEVLKLPKPSGWETKQFHGWTPRDTGRIMAEQPDRWVAVGMAALDAHRMIYETEKKG
ncbi:MAG TPA: hypothetical protein VI934_01160 [Candidatus Nanoarchaeia archaeon]|nr:hypothetical protein [Candidatus Nanoarchaeia archaeon]